MTYENFKAGLRILRSRISPALVRHQDELEVSNSTLFDAIFSNVESVEIPQPSSTSSSTNPPYVYDPSVDAVRCSIYVAFVREINLAYDRPENERRPRFEQLDRMMFRILEELERDPFFADDEEREAETEQWFGKYLEGWKKLLEEVKGDPNLTKLAREALKTTCRIIG